MSDPLKPEDLEKHWTPAPRRYGDAETSGYASIGGSSLTWWQWRSMDEAPRDKPILLYGSLSGSALNEWHPTQPIRAVGYWDAIDEAWALSDTPYYGPFFEPLCWAELLDAPGPETLAFVKVDTG